MREQEPNSSSAINLHPPLNEVSCSSTGEEIAAARQSPPREVLTELLRDSESARIALYVPEVWLPDSEMPEYQEAFLDAWWSLLGQVDQRADFVDGDIGELGVEVQRPLVAKAAHMMPMLRRHGLITDGDVEYILRGTDSKILRASIADARRATPQAAPVAQITDASLLYQQVIHDSTRSEDSPARQRWLRTQLTDTAVREAARPLSRQHVDQLLMSHESFDREIALQALSRQIRQGTAETHESSIIERAYQQDDHPEVRTRAARALRQLYHANHVGRDVLESHQITVPRLAGQLSDNLNTMSPEIDRIKRSVAEIARDPLLSRSLYPVIAVGGSRLKGYGEESADIDMVVFFRPEARESQELNKAISRLFHDDQPIEAHLIHTPAGVRLPDEEAQIGHMASDWSHVLYSMAWIGGDETVQMLRRELTADYHTDHTLRRLALRRLEQDSLQYRLMHKGYERHYAIRSDDEAIAPDYIDSQSVYWDPGYRRLATQLFAEKVRLPRVK